MTKLVDEDRVVLRVCVCFVAKISSGGNYVLETTFLLYAAIYILHDKPTLVDADRCAIALLLPPRNKSDRGSAGSHRRISGFESA